MIQLNITDPNQWERDVIRELLDHWPQEAPLPFEINQEVVTPHQEPSTLCCEDLAIETPSTFDKDGLPWDERIHSSNKQLTQDGFWRKRRGVTEELVTKVEGELRGPAEGPPPIDVRPITSPPPPPPTTPDNPMGPFIAFVGRTMAAIGGKTLTQAQVDQVCQKHGVSSLAALGQRPELVAVVEEELFKS